MASPIEGLSWPELGGAIGGIVIAIAAFLRGIKGAPPAGPTTVLAGGIIDNSKVANLEDKFDSLIQSNTRLATALEEFVTHQQDLERKARHKAETEDMIEETMKRMMLEMAKDPAVMPKVR